MESNSTISLGHNYHMRLYHIQLTAPHTIIIMSQLSHCRDEYLYTICFPNSDINREPSFLSNNLFITACRFPSISSSLARTNLTDVPRPSLISCQNSFHPRRWRATMSTLSTLISARTPHCSFYVGTLT
jgi:hypothetical protein